MVKKKISIKEKKNIILASSSTSRRKILNATGIKFLSKNPAVDEEILKMSFKGNPKNLALMLAEEKALSVSQDYSKSYVIGADQVLSFKGASFNKPKTLKQAKENLLVFRGKKHKLESATVIAHNGRIIWRLQESPVLTMRSFSDSFLNSYIKIAGDKTLLSSGGYSIEKEGSQLFSKVEGDFFTIVGLPLVPLLQKLRKLKPVGFLE
jgi:septum formation protein